jgi:hypothetical protein
MTLRKGWLYNLKKITQRRTAVAAPRRKLRIIPLTV